MNNMFNLLAAEGGKAQAGGGAGILMSILPFVLMIAVFYFLLIRPQKKQEKQTAAMRNSLSVGDEITTIGGIIGRVTHVKDDVITIESGADRNKIRIRKSAVATVDKKYDEVGNVPAGGYKVKSVKKSSDVEEANETVEKPVGEAPVLKEDVKKEKKAKKSKEEK